MLQPFARAVALRETHEQRAPAIRVDAIVVTVHPDRLVNMHAGDANLERRQVARAERSVVG